MRAPSGDPGMYATMEHWFSKIGLRVLRGVVRGGDGGGLEYGQDRDVEIEGPWI